MNNLPIEAIEFLESQRTGVMAVKMLDGSPHGATLHFAYKADTATFIFLTSPSYRKAEPLRKGDTPASFVVGASDGVMKTMQLDGIAKLEDSEEIRNIYFKRFPDKLGKKPDDIFFTFTPTWWRFTDWTAPKERRILLSE